MQPSVPPENQEMRLDGPETGAFLTHQIKRAAQQYEILLGQLPSSPARFPRSFKPDGLLLVPPEDWTSGFFPGTLWLLHEATGSHVFRAAAETYMAPLAAVKDLRGTHDLGFMLNCSIGQALRITGQRDCAEILVTGARTLIERYNPTVGLIRSWSFPPYRYPVIIDNTMNLELLFVAHEITKEARFWDIACRHADRTMKDHFRPDGSSWHLVDYNEGDGSVIRRQTVQGYADDSAWARGQAWALYGYTMAYRFTKNPAYLGQATRVADYVISHPRLPADKVPYWDFDAPNIPNALRDSSAGAIISSALFELASIVAPARGERYATVAARMLSTLASPSFHAAPGENGGFLLRHGVGFLARGADVDQPLNYGDYYYMEALLRWRARLASSRKP